MDECAHAIDPNAEHPALVYLARCGHRVLRQTTVSDVPQGQPCPSCRRARSGDKWHLDEMYIKINGKTHYLWRAVDQHGNVLDILVTARRDTRTATRFFPKLLTGLEYVPRVLVTDKLASYGVAHR